MNGYQLAGTSETRERAPQDFYATPPESTAALLEREHIVYPVLEPACGAGHIAELLDDTQKIYASDLVDRGYGEVRDFLTADPPSDIQTVITNPPFNLFQEFAEKALNVAKHKVILFGKLQALEGKRRAAFLETSPLRTIYVFKSRQNPLRNGSAVDEQGKPWASTMAFAWFVWEQGYTGKPIIEWI